jgi:DNA invertase Pin-like site-specific DNA recombinase
MTIDRFVAYYRVSTDRQGKSGLGLEAQREAVQSYLDGGSWTLAAEVTEVESGKRNDRPELDRALGLCRLYGATLVVAKLDRLARNVAFISKLMESGVDFVAVDFPQANRLTVHILAAVAEHEAAMISARTKAAPWLPPRRAASSWAIPPTCAASSTAAPRATPRRRPRRPSGPPTCSRSSCR